MDDRDGEKKVETKGPGGRQLQSVGYGRVYLSSEPAGRERRQLGSAHTEHLGAQ